MILYFNSKEKIVGSFLILVFILLLSMVVLIGRGKDWFRKNIIYYASFSESYNLDTNAPVKLFNADIGKVKQITLVGDKVEVTLAIFEDYAHRIKTDSVATVDGISYIGKKYISIKPGTEQSALLSEGKMIPSKENKSIADILAEFEVEKTAKMVIKAVQDLAELAQMLKNPRGPLFKALESINTSLAEIEKRIGAIMENAVVATSKVPGTVDQATADLVKIHEIGNEVLKNIATIKKILGNLEKGSRNIPPVTRSAKNRLQEAGRLMNNANQITRSLKKNILIRSNIPPAPKGKGADAGLR